jgi:hypothetical protein
MSAAYRMADATTGFVVVLNAGEEPATLVVPLNERDGALLQPELPVGWPWAAGDPAEIHDGTATVTLPARSARLLRIR